MSDDWTEDDKSPHPLVPSDPPFRDLVERLRLEGEALVEARKGIVEATEKRLRDLQELHEQIRRKAEQILADTRNDLALHDVRFSCAKRPGGVYYLYERGGDRWFTILEPDEYRRADPRAHYLGAWRLEWDSTWRRLDPERDPAPGGGAGRG